MKEVVCEKCGYRFKAEIDHKICPYCGEEKTLGEPKKAQELINEQE